MQKLWALSLGIYLVAVVGCGGEATLNGSRQARHVALVVLEGYSLEEMIGNPAMPYLNELTAR